RGVRSAQAGRMPALMEMRLETLERLEAPGRGKGVPPHGFPGQGKGRGQDKAAPGRSDGIFHPEGTAFIQAGSIDRWETGVLILRVMFAAVMLALMAYVVVKLFQPGGWQLSFGPLHVPTDEDNPKAKGSKSGRSKKK
ncbi:MAG: hypothetical protein OEV06_08115, partial [Anaerolineae bacterium]|nr:hypothetical protein [Anaerolineae bacterium]